MGGHFPSPQELFGSQQERQRQLDEYNAGVAREKAEIAARLAGKPDAKSLAALSPAAYSWGADYSEGPPKKEKPRPKRDLFGPDLIFRGPPPKPKFVVHGLFSTWTLNLLVGDPGHKKSILAVDLGLSVAMGKPWLGQEVGSLNSFYSSSSASEEPSEAKQGEEPSSGIPVLLVEEESGLLALWRRLHAAFLGHGATPQIPFHFISMGNYDFHDPEDADDLIQHARSVDARLIIIDSLADVMLGSDENSVLSMQPILHNLRKVAHDCSAAVVIVHHTNKSGLFRGSTSLSAGVNHMLQVYSPPGQNLIRLSTLKSRDLEPITLHARAHFEPDRFYLTPTDERFPPHLSKVEHAVLSYIGEHQTVSTHDLQSYLDFTSPGNIRTALHNLKGSKYIHRTNGDKRGEKAIFQLTEKGQNLVKELDNDSNP